MRDLGTLPKRLLLSAPISCGLFLLSLSTLRTATGVAAATGREAPEFPSLEAASWAGPPTSLASLRGNVVLLNVWTFGCINCRRTLPWVESVHERFGKRGVAVIGVHSPEFDYESSVKDVEKARKRERLLYPSFIDNSHAYWRALENDYWPTVYLIDKAGRVRRVQVGEVHAGDRAATALEGEIELLLAEAAVHTPTEK